MTRILLLAFSLSASIAQAQLSSFASQQHPAAPDYSLQENWAALPFYNDAADAVPKELPVISDSLKEVDVFFIHPTTYGGGSNWNADLRDAKVNKKTDEKPILYQATVFNESARVYAPRYRQAVFEAFFQEGEDSRAAFALAYEDVRNAFLYYMEHYNNGRPIIIATHSQGTLHGRKLVQDFFDGKQLGNKLVAAYLVGYAVPKSLYQMLQPCEDSTDTGCLLSWASYKKGFVPDENFYVNSVCVNPVSWRCDSVACDRSYSKGSMLFKFNKKFDAACGAQIHHNYLWVDTRLGLVKGRNNLHVGDYNLFWYDIRADVKRRVRNFWKKRAK